MINKGYLEELKKEDYIAWYDLVNDPTMCGTGGNGGGWLIILAILSIITILTILFI